MTSFTSITLAAEWQVDYSGQGQKQLGTKLNNPEGDDGGLDQLGDGGV